MQRDDNNLSPLLQHSLVRKSSMAKMRVDRALSKAKNRVKGFPVTSKIISGLYLSEFLSVDQANKVMRHINTTDFVLGRVVSAVEPIEFIGGMQSPRDWKKSQVEHYLQNVVDHQADTDIEGMCEAVKCIDDTLRSKRSSLVHCKAGQSRSTMIVICYLYIKMRGRSIEIPEDATVENICAFVKERRPQADIGPHHLDTINRVIFHYLNYFQEIVPYSFNLDNLPKQNLDNLFSSEPFKRQILQVCAIKDLLIYAAHNQKDRRMTIINDFIKLIANANDCTWFMDLILNRGPMKLLLEYRPQGDSEIVKLLNLGYSEERKTLHCNLRDEILLLVCNISSYTLDDIENAANRDFGNKVAMKWTH
jgi:hypothetical protein